MANAKPPAGMTPQLLPRNERVIPVKEKMHPAAKQAIASFTALHSHKFAANAGRGWKPKARALS